MNTRKKNARKMHTRKSLVSVLMFVCVLLSACAPGTATLLPSSPPTTFPSEQAMPTDSFTPTPLSETTGVGKILETISLPVNPNRDSVYAFGSLWSLYDADGTVTRWDPMSRQVLATITVGDPGKAPYGDPVNAVATADSIWVTSVASREIVRIDPNTNQIRERIPLGQVDGKDFVTTGMIGDDNNLWVWDYDRQITLRINLKTKLVAATIPDVRPAVLADGSFWAWDSKYPKSARNLFRIDPATDQVIAKIPLDSVNDQNASNENSVWLGHGNEVLRIDPKTNQLIGAIEIGVEVRVVQFIDGNVWVTASPVPPACHDVNQSFLARIDPTTNAIVGKIGLDCPGEIFDIQDTVWVYTGINESNYGNLNAVVIQPNE